MSDIELDNLIERLKTAGADGDAIYLWNMCVTAADAIDTLCDERERAARNHKAALEVQDILIRSIENVEQQVASLSSENTRLREELAAARLYRSVKEKRDE